MCWFTFYNETINGRIANLASHGPGNKIRIKKERKNKLEPATAVAGVEDIPGVYQRNQTKTYKLLDFLVRSSCSLARQEESQSSTWRWALTVPASVERWSTTAPQNRDWNDSQTPDVFDHFSSIKGRRKDLQGTTKSVLFHFNLFVLIRRKELDSSLQPCPLVWKQCGDSMVYAITAGATSQIYYRG